MANSLAYVIGSQQIGNKQKAALKPFEQKIRQ